MFVRPLGGALIAVVVLGGSVAAGTHLTEAGTRAVVNTSPEPVSNGVISLAENVLVVGLGYLASVTQPPRWSSWDCCCWSCWLLGE